MAKKSSRAKKSGTAKKSGKRELIDTGQSQDVRPARRARTVQGDGRGPDDRSQRSAAEGRDTRAEGTRRSRRSVIGAMRSAHDVPDSSSSVVGGGARSTA